jgi:phosphate:Na+ symporter
MLGKGILAFGLIFIGMTFMEGAVAPLKNSETFKQLFLKFGQVPILGILVSTLFTGIEQSSSVTVGIIQALASQNLINLRTAFALVLGANIGTTVTALIASIGGNVSARRVALAHVLFNVGGVLIFLPFFTLYVSFVSHTSISLVRQIANSHSLFNIICTFLYLPFYKPYARLVEKMVPGDEKVIEGGAKYINAKLLKVPTVAVEAIRNELYRLKETVKTNFKCLFDMIAKNDGKLFKEIQFRERAINDITKEIQTFISKVFGSLVSEEEAEKVTSYLNISIQLERIGDIVKGTSELMIEKIGNGIMFSEYAQEDLKNMMNTVNKEFEITTENLEAIDEETFLAVDTMEGTVDELEVELRDKHVKRLTEGVCTTEAGLLYIDVLSNLERMSDHIYKIARLLKPAEEKNNSN